MTNSTETPRQDTRTKKTDSTTPKEKKPRKGQENLVSLADRTTDEQRVISTMGGIASGKARAEKRTFRETFEILLNTPIKDGDVENIKGLKNLKGLESKNFTAKDIITIQVMQRAMNGDLKAYESIRDTVGEIIEQNMRVNVEVKASEDKLAEMKKKIDKDPELRGKLFDDESNR